MTDGPLHGIRVVDLTSVVVGPICTRVLADQGADVVKIEPAEGDLLRHLARGRPGGKMSGKFIQFNRNKKSVCLDLKKASGSDALHRLLQQADVFVSNMRAPALKRLGLDTAELSRRYPRLIQCNILAFGPGGRYANRPAYDSIIQSLSGVAGTFERALGQPRFVPMVMADHIAGLTAAQCIGFALYRREHTGCGEAIEVPMFENMVAFVLAEHMGAGTFDPPVGPYGDERLLSPDYRPLETQDSYITMTANTNAQAFAFFDVIGRPELKTDPRFCSIAARVAHTKEYFLIRTEALRQRTTAEWLDIFQRLDIPAAPYNRIEDLLGDPHLADVSFFCSEEHPREGRLWRTRTANTFSGGMRTDHLPAPTLGEHTEQVLLEAGLSSEQVREVLDDVAAASKPREGRSDNRAGSA